MAQPPNFLPSLCLPLPLTMGFQGWGRDSQVAQVQHLERSLLSLLAIRTGRTRSLHISTQPLVCWVCLGDRQLPTQWVYVASWAHGEIPPQHWEFVVLDLCSLHLPNVPFSFPI